MSIRNAGEPVTELTFSLNLSLAIESPPILPAPVRVGEAIRYLLKRWEKLTVFLRQAGAPLDSNIVERALKKAILNRKNAMFYKTRNGARVGDLFMSLIHT